jgi:hypothetical protein
MPVEWAFLDGYVFVIRSRERTHARRRERTEARHHGDGSGCDRRENFFVQNAREGTRDDEISLRARESATK